MGLFLLVITISLLGIAIILPSAGSPATFGLILLGLGFVISQDNETIL